MSFAEWSILLFAVGLILLIAELFLPAHGLILALGALCVLAGIGLCFVINPWLGVGTFVGWGVATPILFAVLTKFVPRTPLGRQLVLPPIKNSIPPVLVQIGQTGTTLSELRPMGMCDFDGVRIEAISELGMIGAGTKVVVVNLANRQPTVRPA